MKTRFIILILSICIFPSVFSCSCISAEHFNELAAREEKESANVIPHLELKKGDSVADLGAGGGYFSFKLAEAVGSSGKVYAIDIDPESIAFIRKKITEKNAGNIEAVLAAYDDSKLAPASVDLVFIRNAYHDFQDRVRYFARLKSVLKPGGRIAIIDYDKSKLGLFRGIFGHALDEKIIIAEMKQAGYIKTRSYTFLKQQSFNIFIVE